MRTNRRHLGLGSLCLIALPMIGCHTSQPPTGQTSNAPHPQAHTSDARGSSLENQPAKTASASLSETASDDQPAGPLPPSPPDASSPNPNQPLAVGNPSTPAAGRRNLDPTPDPQTTMSNAGSASPHVPRSALRRATPQIAISDHHPHANRDDHSIPLRLGPPVPDVTDLSLCGPTSIKFTVTPAGQPTGQWPTWVTLEVIDPTGQPIETLGRLPHAGILESGRHVYCGQISIHRKSEGAISIRAVARVNGSVIASEQVARLSVSRFPTTDLLPVSQKVVVDPATGRTFRANELIVQFREGCRPRMIEKTVAQERAEIVGTIDTDRLVFRLQIRGAPTAAAVLSAADVFESYDVVVTASPSVIVNKAGPGVETAPDDTITP